MSDERPSRLYYTGDGSRGFPGVPRRDLEGKDLARLTDARYREITGKGPDGHALYQKSKPSNRVSPQNHTWKRNRASVSDATPVEAVQEPEVAPDKS